MREAGGEPAARPIVTLVEGSDPTLVAEAAASVIDKLVGNADRSLVLEDHFGDQVDLAAVADACATPPFLAGWRVVVVREMGQWTAAEATPLLAYLDDPLPSTALVLVAGGGQTAAKLATAVSTKGQVVSTAVDSRHSGDWLHDRIRTSDLALDAGAERLLRDHLGEDVSLVVPLLELLRSAYGTGARLDGEDIVPYLGEAGSVTPWAFTDAIDQGDAGLALVRLHRIMYGGHRHPLVVLAILHRHVQSLMRVDHPAIRTEAQAAEALGIARGRSTFPAKKAWRAAQEWGSAGIAEAVSLVAGAEVDLKGASASSEAAILEILVGRLCRLARARPLRSRAAARA